MINETCPLVISNAYEYDFSTCAYRLLKNIGCDLTNIDYEDKVKRNIQIGLLQRDNPRLNVYLRDSVENLIDHYITENKLKKDEIILRQFDGITVTRKLTKIDTSMPLDLKKIISKMIITKERKSWLNLSDDEIVVKGVSNLPISITFYNLFRNLEFSNRTILSNQLESIRKKIFKDPDIDWYMFDESGDSFSIPIKNEGFIIFRRSTISTLRKSDLDHNFLWDTYLWPFVEPLMLQIL